MNDDDDKIFSDTLYVCGLPDVDQEDINETFSAFGSVDSIKFLDPDKKTAFIKFNSSHEAEDAHKYSKGLLIKDSLIKVCWGRQSHLDPQSKKQQTSTSTNNSYFSNTSSSSSSSSSSYYNHRHGYSHRESHYYSSSSSSSSSHSHDHSSHSHYRSHHHNSHSRDRSKDRERPSHRNSHHSKESTQENKLIDQPPVLPIPPQQNAQEDFFPTPLAQGLPLRPDQEDQLTQLFEKLDGTLESIKNFSTWIIANTLSEFDVNSVILEIVSGTQKANHAKRFFMLFVLTDVFCQKALTRKAPLELDLFSATFLKHIPTMVTEVIKCATREEKDKISAILELWKKREIYWPSLVDTFLPALTDAEQTVNNKRAEDSEPTPGEFASMNLFSEAKYGQAPIYYTPFNSSIFRDADMTSVDCSDEEIAAIYNHFKKRVRAELEIMDKTAEERMAMNFANGNDADDGNDFDPNDDGYSSLDSDDFSDSDYELDSKKIKFNTF